MILLRLLMFPFLLVYALLVAVLLVLAGTVGWVAAGAMKITITLPTIR
jgi:hypothetical protein